MLTGESLPVDKNTAPSPGGSALAELTGCALMGTVVHAGGGRGVVVSTGGRSEFGKIAAGLSTHQLDTEFQVGLRRFSMLLVYVAAVLTTSIFVINVALHRPVIDALLFSLAIAVGITPQLLPAVVATSLAAGSRRMSRRKVLVKRLVCIEDLGDVDVLFTDKTGTLTEGRITFMRAIPAGSRSQQDVLRWGLLSCDVTVENGRAVGGNPLDEALWNSPAACVLQSPQGTYEVQGVLPFDHERRMISTVVSDPDGDKTLVTKGAPEAVLDRCVDVPEGARAALAVEFAAGNRVVAVAIRPAPGIVTPTAADENGLVLVGLLVFLDPPKRDAAGALRRLADLGITVKIVTGDSAAVAVKVCNDLRLVSGGALTGADLEALDDDQLASAIGTTTVFARVSPEQKARIVRVQRRTGGDVAFLGDGVNDALALHAADVGISVDSGTDVSKDAADVILLEKDLDVLADGVVEGRRIFANTIKYVLMGTSSNFGNMFSAAGASLFLKFLPMLPSQILLNNLLYDTSQLAIPTDNVDEEQLSKPSQWDIRFIRRFMIFFGPISSLFDFVTFGVMLLGVPFRPCPVPLRVVRGVARHPDTRDLCDTHPPDPVLPQSSEPAVDLRRARGGHRRGLAASDTVRRHPGLPCVAGGLLRSARRHGRRLPGSHRDRQADLLRYPASPGQSAGRAATSSPAAPRRPLHHGEASGVITLRVCARGRPQAPSARAPSRSSPRAGCRKGRGW